MCLNDAFSNCGSAFAKCLVTIHRLLECFATTVVIFTLVTTLMVVLFIGVGLGYHYRNVQANSVPLTLQDYWASNTNWTTRRYNTSVYIYGWYWDPMVYTIVFNIENSKTFFNYYYRFVYRRNKFNTYIKYYNKYYMEDHVVPIPFYIDNNTIMSFYMQYKKTNRTRSDQNSTPAAFGGENRYYKTEVFYIYEEPIFYYPKNKSRKTPWPPRTGFY